MNYDDKQLQKFQNSAFNFALYKVKNFEIAEEISLEVISLFLLRHDKIENPERWIISSTGIYCKKHFRLEKEAKKLETSIHNELSNHIDKFSDTNTELSKSFKESYQSLKEDELSTLLYYFGCGKSIKKMQMNTGESYAALRKRISRIRNKIKAETFKNLGYYGTKKVVTPQLNDLIKKFLKRFKEHVENDSLNKMFYYFSEIDLNKYDFKFDIKKILDYDISIENFVYRTWVVFENSIGIPNSFEMSFVVNENNHLKIVSPPTQLNKMKMVKVDSLEGQMIKDILSKVPEDLSGRPNISKAELESLLKKIKQSQQDIQNPK